jgi:hypothetical protein
MSEDMGRRTRVDRPRVVGTLDERIMLHLAAREILDLMPDIHPELDIDVEALDHIRLGFLREPCKKWGLCSYSNKPNGYATEYQDRNRTHRILISRLHMREDLEEAIRTIHHELLHAILGAGEGHGLTFTMHESRFADWAEKIVRLVELFRSES